MHRNPGLGVVATDAGTILAVVVVTVAIRLFYRAYHLVGAILNTGRELVLSPQQHYELGTSVFPVSQIRELRHRQAPAEGPGCEPRGSTQQNQEGY